MTRPAARAPPRPPRPRVECPDTLRSAGQPLWRLPPAIAPFRNCRGWAPAQAHERKRPAGWAGRFGGTRTVASEGNLIGLQRDDDGAFAAPAFQLDAVANAPGQQTPAGATQVFVRAG